jgi:hypothetical protein
MCVGVLGPRQLPRLRINVVMSLSVTGDAIGPVQSGVEPLRGVRCCHLIEQHVGDLIVERLSIFRCVKVAVLLSPPTPASGKTVDHLADGALGSHQLLAVLIRERLAFSVDLRYTRLSKVLLRKDVGCDLRPLLRHLYVVHLKNDRAVRVSKN